MPALALVYALFVCYLTVDSLLGDLKEKKPAWYAMLNLASNLTLFLVFIGYWTRGLIVGMGFIAPCLFLFSLIWEICTIGHGWEHHLWRFSPEQRPLRKRLGTGLEVVAAFPGYWFGGIAVLRAL